MPTKYDLQSIKKDLMESFADIPESMGLSRVLGIIWGTLAFEKDGLSMKELSEKTGYSLSSLSPHLKMLQKAYKVKCTKERGVTIYKAVTSMQEIMEQFVKDMIHNKIEPMIKKLEDAEEKLTALEQTNEVKNTLELVRQIRDDHENARNMWLMMSKMHDSGEHEKIHTPEEQEKKHGYG